MGNPIKTVESPLQKLQYHLALQQENINAGLLGSYHCPS